MSENPTAIGSQGYSLRPYQTQLLDKTRAKFSAGTRSIMVSPTGSRKTILFCSVVDGAMRNGKRCLVFTHRREIAEQTSGALACFAVMHGIVMAGTKPAPGLPVRLASISTLMHQLDEYSNFDLRSGPPQHGPNMAASDRCDAASADPGNDRHEASP
jgi:superfamily II DNA or RNA helicase